MNEVFILLIGFVVSGLVQLSKKYFKTVNPLIIVAVFSVIASAAYVLAANYGLISPTVVKMFYGITATAVLVYNFLKQFATEKK